MIDQSHNVEGKIDAMLQSVMNIQTAYVKALLVDDAALSTAQAQGDVLGAHRALTDAFETDVRPVVAKWRADRGLDPDPVGAFRDGGYAEERARKRGTTQVQSAYEKQ
jgi:L-rhamnose isomerase/sugar isomerase